MCFALLAQVPPLPFSPSFLFRLTFNLNFLLRNCERRVRKNLVCENLVLLTASRNNALRNEVSYAAFPVVLPQDDLIVSWQASADWVVANILAGPLVALAPVLTALMAPRGRLLLAGLLVDQAQAVVEVYAPGVALSVADQQEEWVLLAGENR